MADWPLGKHVLEEIQICEVAMTHFLVWKPLILTPCLLTLFHVHFHNPLESRARFQRLVCDTSFWAVISAKRIEEPGRLVREGGKDNVSKCHWATEHSCGQLGFNPSRTFWGVSIMQFRTLSLKDEEGSLYPPIPSHLRTTNYQELPHNFQLHFKFCACQSGEWTSGQKAERGVAAEARWCQVTPA